MSESEIRKLIEAVRGPVPHRELEKLADPAEKELDQLCGLLFRQQELIAAPAAPPPPSAPEPARGD